MNANKIIIPIEILAAAILIIMGGYLIFNSASENPDKESGLVHQEPDGGVINQSEENVITEESEKSVETTETYTSTFGELKKTSNPKFKVGEKYLYHRWEKPPDEKDAISPPKEYDTVVEVKRTERRNKSDYYIIESTNASVDVYMLIKENGVWRKSQGVAFRTVTVLDENGTEKKETVTTGPAIYEGCMQGINEETGEIIQIKSTSCPVLWKMYNTWMLYLDNGVRWVEKQNVSSIGTEKEVRFETEWRVADIEKVNGRKCFKVIVNFKKEIMGISGKEISGRVITYWVDTEKRIAVKMEWREENTLTETIELKE